VDGSSDGDQRGVVADAGGCVVAGCAGCVWELEDDLQPALSVAAEGVWAGILEELRRGCDEVEGPGWTVAVDGTVVRAHQHAAGARHTLPAHTGGSVE
jgi:hypothetical protein